MKAFGSEANGYTLPLPHTLTHPHTLPHAEAQRPDVSGADEGWRFFLSPNLKYLTQHNIIIIIILLYRLSDFQI